MKGRSGIVMAIEEHDERSIRCRRLGHAVTFRYCRLQEGGTMCPRILDCWWETFDVRAFLEGHLPPGEMERLVSREVRPKVLSLVELIEQAKRHARDEPGQ